MINLRSIHEKPRDQRESEMLSRFAVNSRKYAEIRNLYFFANSLFDVAWCQAMVPRGKFSARGGTFLRDYRLSRFLRARYPYLQFPTALAEI